MKKYTILILIFFGLFSASLAQKKTSSDNFDYSKPYSEIVKEKEAYFKLQVEQFGPKILESEGSEYRDYQRWKKLWGPRIAPDNSVQNYVQGLAGQNKNNQSAGNKSMAFGNTDGWKELGPWDKPNAGLTTIGTGGDRGVGIIASIAINRIDPNKMLANSRAGGLFFSSDKGLTWANAGSDLWFRSGCESAAFAPNDLVTWYAASNIGGSYYKSPIGSVGGVYRTTNAGVSWDIIADRTTFNANAVTGEGTMIHKIIIDPKNPSVGYIATNIGLFISTNINNPNPALVTWGAAPTPILNGYIEDIEFKTDNSPVSTLIVSYNNPSWDIATTNNQGSTWTSLPSQPSHVSTNQIVIEVTDANSDLLYIIDRKGSGDLWVYNFALNTWTPGYSGLGTPVGGGHAFGISNFNSNIVYCSQDCRLFKSTNGGLTFSPINQNPSGATPYHVDIEDVITPPGSCVACSLDVFVSTHGGINYSPDEIATLQTRSNGLGIAGISGGAAGAQLNPEEIAMGLDHDGSVLSSGLYSNTWVPAWSTVNDGDGGSAMIDYSNSNYVWTEYQSSPPSISSTGGSAYTYVSTNFPANNEFESNFVQNKKYPAICYSMKSTNNGSLLYEDLIRSDNRGLIGSTIEQLSDFKNTHSLPDYYFLWGIFPAISDANVMYLAETNPNTWNVHFYRNTNIMAAAASVVSSWTELTLPVPLSAGTIAVDAVNSNIVYVGYGGYSWQASKFYIVDYSNPLSPIQSNVAGISGSGGLPNTSITQIAVEKGSNGGVYVATDIGVYYANNSTLDKTNPANCIWTLLGTNLPHIPLTGIEINYTANKIRASTFGRGIWEHDLFCPAYTSIALNGPQNITVFNEAQNEIVSAQTPISSITMSYRAGTYVRLDPGFMAAPNSSNDFIAFIHPCSYPGNSPGLKISNESILQAVPIENEEKQGENLDLNGKTYKVFPNPANNELFVIIMAENCKIEIFNVIGQKVFTQNLSKGDNKLNLQGLNNGIYTYKIINDGLNAKSDKLIISH